MPTLDKNVTEAANRGKLAHMGTVGAVRTFESVKIKFGPSCRVCQIDRWTGEPLSGDKATETHIILDATLELRGLSQGFVVLGKIGQKEFDTNKLEAKVKAAIIANLPNRVVLDFFRITEITVKTEDRELDVWETDSQIDNLHAPRLEEQAKAGNQAANEWKVAIQEMQDGLRDGFEYNRDKIRNGMMFLERCHRAANNGMMYAWCEEKLERIRSGLTDLARRKNPNHPNYTRTVDNIWGWLGRWPVANSWHDQPPRRPKNTA